MFRVLLIFLLFRDFIASYKIIYKGKGQYVYETSPISLQIGKCVTLTALSHFPTNGSESITWKKDTQLLSNQERISINGQSVRISSLKLSDHAYYQATIVNNFSKVTEVTDIWLHVRDCGKNEKQLLPSSSQSCQNRCEEKCPSDWVYVIGTSSKCCKYFGTGQTWTKASENCQALGGELTTIDNEIENKFISNLLTTAAGAWIGLNDRETESRYVWNFKQTVTQTYFIWGLGEPSNYNGNCNIENCVAMKQGGRWIDVVCGSFNPYVCQVSSIYNGSDIEDWYCSGGSCYKQFDDLLVWSEAATRCKSIHASGHLVAITSSSVNGIVNSLIKEDTWIGLNDIREAGSYRWKDSGASYSYKNWDSGEPNDMFYRDKLVQCSGEDCIQIKKFAGNVTWQDLGCDTVLPYICERVRDRAFSTGAYVAIVIGTLLLAFIIIGLAHAAYQKSKRTAVKDIIKAAYQEDIKLREEEKKETREKLSFRSAAKKVLPSIRIQPQ